MSPVLRKVANSGGEKLIRYHCIMLEIKRVMDTVVKTLNFLKSKKSESAPSQDFLEQSDADFSDVVDFAAVRRLSRGATLKHFFNLRKEIREFVESKGEDVTLNGSVT